MILSPKQKSSIKEAQARLNIWEGSIRASKTVGSIVRWIQYIGAECPKNGIPFMVGKTERTLKNNILVPMKAQLGNSFTYSLGSHKANLFGRELELYGANDLRSEGKIRGITGAGAYCDEITLYPESFFKQVLGRCSVDRAKIFGTTNTDSPYHYLKKDYLDRAGELDLKSFHFQLEDNPFLPKSYIESIKKEYTGLYFKRFILGLWVSAEGAIYDFFEEKEPYLIKELPDATQYFVSIDYGTQNPTGFGLFGYNPSSMPKVWLEDLYYYSGRDSQRQKTDSEYSADLKEFLGKKKPWKIYVDPSASSFITQLKSDGFTQIETADNAVLDGIRTMAKMLKSGEFAVYYRLEKFIEEIQGYVWDTKASGKGEDKPLKVNDHVMDLCRYLLHSRFGKRILDYSKLNRW